MNHDDFHGEMDCEQVRAELAEFALGVVPGRERAAILEHLDHCEDCNAEVEQLVALTDVIDQLAPQGDPPLGFEVRVLERLRMLDASKSSRVPRRWVFAAAASLLLVLGVGLALGVGLSGSNGVKAPSALSVRSETLRSPTGVDRGDVVVLGGSSPAMLVSVDATAWSGWIQCTLDLRGGSRVSLGRFRISSGYGTWRVKIPVAIGQVKSAQLTSDSGQLFASAKIS